MSANRKPVAGEELTERELEVWQMIADERHNPEIARRLGLNVRTVESHRRTLMLKLNVYTIAGLTKLAIKRNMVTGQVRRFGPR